MIYNIKSMLVYIQNKKNTYVTKLTVKTLFFINASKLK